MASARYAHSLTLLPNGKVLVAGGHDGSPTGGGTLSSAELYDPATGTWTATGAMQSACQKHTATLLPNGKVLVAGGSYDGSELSDAELYDPATGRWTATGTMTARMGHSAASLPNGKVLVAGGFGGNADSSAVSSADLYDPPTGTWATTASMSTPRGYFPMVLLRNGKVLVAGGYDHYTPTVSSADLFVPSFLPLEITTQPQSQTGYWGKSINLSVETTGGALPLSYQWLKGGVSIEGATGPQLVLSDLKDTDAGDYTVTVTDAANNSVTSQTPAALTVLPDVGIATYAAVLPDVGIATYAGLTIKGGVGQTYGIQATTDLSNASWVGVANVTLTQPTQIWYDSQSTAEQPKRFYRVVAGPISIP